MAYLYRLTSPSGKSYIGIAKDYRRRWAIHRYRANQNGQGALYAAIRKYKWESFSSEVLVIGSFEYVKEMEVKAIAAFNTYHPHGYNLTRGGDGVVGRRTPQDVRDKIAAGNRGKTMTAASRKKLSIARKGGTISPEQRIKISIKMKQVCNSEWRKRRAEMQRKLWADPEYRAMMLAKRKPRTIQSSKPAPS
jgi:group I intron endonuclease